MTTEQQRRDRASDASVKPAAGIWACPNCGRRIQVITESAQPQKQPFSCVCGAAMKPGEEHAEIEASSPG